MMAGVPGNILRVNLESRGPQVAKLRTERGYVADVVVPARLLQRHPVLPPGRRLGIVMGAHPFPGGLDDGIGGPHRVVVEVPAARDQVVVYLGEQASADFQMAALVSAGSPIGKGYGACR